MRSSDYWEKRALQREAEAYSDTAEVVQRLHAIYGEAGKRLSDVAKNIFSNYLKASGGIDPEEAKKMLSVEESADLLKQLREDVSKSGNPETLARLNAQPYAYRISRVQALHKAIDAETDALAAAEERLGKQHLVKAYDDGYYKTMYDAANQEGGINFASLSYDAVLQAVENKWKGENYSSRVWKNRDVVAQEAGKIIDSGVSSGSGVYKMAAELRDLLDVGAYASQRLIRTETNRMHNDATLASYRTMGVKEYRYLATLDARTCTVCGALDGKVFKVSDAKTGVNFPPMHPNDRCTTVAYEADEKLDGVRTARDPVTGKNYKVPRDMTYEQWRRHINEKYGAGTLEKAQKMAANKSKDTAQLSVFQKVIGKEAPKNIADFQNLKYNDPEKWEDLKYYFRNKDDRDIAYVKIDRELEKAGINRGKAYPAKPIEINGWREHAEKRLVQRGLTKEQAGDFMSQSKVMMKQYPEPATLFNYYSENGILGVKADSGIIQTVYGKDDFMSETQKIFEVINKYVK